MAESIIAPYLDAVAGCEGNRKPAPGLHYVCVEDFVRNRGQAFSLDGAICRSGEQGRCFWNARRAARRNNWQYVEGYAVSVIPMLHAWCIDQRGRVREVTWDQLGAEYFGVVIPLDQCPIDASYLDDWKRGYPALRLPRR